jgi:biotin carboxylase
MREIDFLSEIVFVESVASGHGPLSLEIAKACGYSVAFFTEDPNFYRRWGSDHPLASVDRLVVTNTMNADAMMSHIEEKTCGIVALDDFHLIPACELAERVALPHANLQGVRCARFKDLTRQRLALSGESRPQFAVFSVSEPLSDSPFGYPCVLKPTDGTASVAVYICNSADQLRERMNTLPAQWTSIRGYQLSRRWLIEEYVEGPEYSAEVIFHNGGWCFLGITKKLLSPPPFCVEVGHVFPASLAIDVENGIKSAVLRWLDALDLDFGAAHVEFRLSNGVPVLMEVNPRLGGDMIPELIRLSTGFDPLVHLFHQASARPVEFDPSAIRIQRAAAIRFVSPEKAGVIDAIQGRELVSSLPFVSRVVLRNTPIHTGRLENSYDRLGYVVGTGADTEDAELNVLDAVLKLHIVYADDHAPSIDTFSRATESLSRVP